MKPKGLIPQAFRDTLLASIDIVDLINSYVPLKKLGNNHKALCPFHNEKTPSFTVNHSKQFYHCFGCGASGNAISFLMEYAHMDFVSTIETLAAMVGVEVPREGQKKNQPSLAHLYDIMQWCAQFFQEQLSHETSGKLAQTYLTKRQLHGKIIDRFHIGYAPTGWDTLIKKSTKPSGLKQLVKTGMVIEKNQGRHYDRFRNRIMFPIRDQRGRVIAFGGRVLDKGVPKYLNSPETTIFSKSQVLYGLYEARCFLNDIPFLLVVEGYMDVIALAQHNIPSAVATLGTAITEYHIKRLYQTTQTIIFCFDGDKAGFKAAYKAMTLVLPFLYEGRQAKFLLLPEGDDPDSLIHRVGTEAFQQKMVESLPLSEFLFQQLSQEGFDSIDDKARIVEKAKPLLTKMPDGVYKKMILQRLTELTGIGSSLNPEKTQPKRTQKNRRMAQLSGAGRLQNSLIRTTIALLLQYPELAEYVGPTELEKLELPGVSLLMEIIRLLHGQPELNTAMIIEKWRETEHISTLQKLASMTLNIPQSGIEAEFVGAIKRLQEKNQQQRLEYLLQKAQNRSLAVEEKSELNALLQK